MAIYEPFVSPFCRPLIARVIPLHYGAPAIKMWR